MLDPRVLALLERMQFERRARRPMGGAPGGMFAGVGAGKPPMFTQPYFPGGPPMMGVQPYFPGKPPLMATQPYFPAMPGGLLGMGPQ